MKKDALKIVIVGHIDHGKSTLIGRLLLDTNSLPREKIAEIKRISKELGKDTELAYLADQLKEEREQSITIDTTQIFFKTPKRNYVIIDAPGHVEFLKNMITGASLAEAAVLIVDAREGIMEQTRRHAYLISMLGLNRVIVACNKMDLVNYQMERFDEIKADLLNFLDNLKIKPAFIIPVSAKEGINIFKKSSAINWYKGPTLLEALDLLKPNIKVSKKALRLPIQDVYEINKEKIIMGRLASGVIKQGQNVIILPSFKRMKIKSIQIFGKYLKRAGEGENVGLTFNASTPVKRGEIIVQRNNPPEPTTRIKGDIFWMSDKPLQINKAMTLRCVTQQVECLAERIEKRINSSTLEVIEEDAKELKLNEAGLVVFKTEKPLVAERFSFIEELGKFIIECNYNLQGAGIILEESPV